MNIDANISSIYANQDFLNQSANNIANVNTQNFERSDTVLEEDGLGGVKASFNKVENPNVYSNTDLTKEITDEIVSSYAIEANAVVLKTQQSVDETLLDIYA